MYKKVKQPQLEGAVNIVECSICHWQYHPSNDEIYAYRLNGKPQDYEWCCSICEFERDDVYTYGYDGETA